MTVDMQGKIGKLEMVIQVKRKDTGEVGEYTLTSEIDEEKARELGLIDAKEADNGSNA
jgi:hypothetical protein